MPMPTDHVPGSPPDVPGYRCERLLGRGGMGEVWLAQHLTLERSVALKVVRPELARDAAFAERFLREARALAKVAHPGVVAVHDAGQSGNHLYLAMELVSNGDLHQLMVARSLKVSGALDLIIQVADGLQAIHDAGLVHRDLKPDNILIDAQGRPRIADLGLARAQQGDDRMTVTGMAMGTPAYMSPEQANGVPDLDGRSDVYSLAATLFALLAGRPPFSGPTPYATVSQVLNSPPPDLHAINSQVPPAVAAVIAQALAKQPGQRPASARAFATALRAAADGQAPVRRLRISRRWIWALGGALITVVVIGVMVASRSGAGAKAEPILWKPDPEAGKTARHAAETPSTGKRETPGEAFRSFKHSFRGTVLETVDGGVPAVRRAMLAALSRQKVTVVKNDGDAMSARIEAQLSDGEDLTVSLTPSGGHATQVAVQIGAFGDAARAHVVLGWLKNEL